jgi:hypothetical protein
MLPVLQLHCWPAAPDSNAMCDVANHNLEVCHVRRFAEVACCSFLPAVLELVLGRFPSDATILTAFTEQALEVAAAAGNASLNSTGPASLLAQHGGGAAAAAAAAQQQQLEVLVLEQLERVEEARAAAVKDEELSYRFGLCCCMCCIVSLHSVCAATFSLLLSSQHAGLHTVFVGD